MDVFQAKFEKANAIERSNIFAAISKTFRILEILIALLLFSWILTRLPFALTVSADYLRQLSAFARSPLFVFALSNAIIAALFAQSGRFAGKHSSADAAALYNELLNSRITSADRAAPPSDSDAPPARVSAEVEFQDKDVVSDTARAAAEVEVQDKVVVTETECADDGAGSGSEFASFRRSQSEKWKGETKKMLRRKQLRRSETEKKRENARENLYPQDKLSNEEFQQAIEAFIAKQMRFLREESSAIVLQN